MRTTRLIFALLLVSITGLITGCEGLSSVPTPPASKYPADIIGRVTVANTVLAPNLKGEKKEATTISKDRVWWIVEVSVRNKEYTLPVSALPNSSTKVSSNVVWAIIYNGKIWSGTKFRSSAEEIPPGQSGKLWLSFESKADFNPADLQLCYQGQEPFSYGELIGGDTVAVYDWDLKKVTQVAETPTATYTVRSHTGYVKMCSTGNNQTTIVFQDGFIVQTVGSIKPELLPGIGQKIKVEYKYSQKYGGNTLISIKDVP